MAAMARWCFRHRAWVLVGWLALLVILGAGGRAVGSAYADSLTLPGTGSSAAQNLIGQAFPGHAGDQDTIVWRASSTGGVRASAVQARITAMLAKVAAAPAVASVTSPYSARGTAQISRNGQIAYATVVFGAQSNKLAKQDVIRVVNLAEAARAPGLQVELGGPAVENNLRPSIGITAGVGVIAAGVVLFIAFGSLLAMLLPLAVAIAGLVSGLMAVGLASHAVSIPTIGPELGVLIGLGVGIDYALFIVTRHRANIKAGMTPAEAAAGALNTSGRAVLFAGATVCIALLGMLVLRISYIGGLGIAAAITVAFTWPPRSPCCPRCWRAGLRVLSRKERRRLAAGSPAPTPHPGRGPGWPDSCSAAPPARRRRHHRDGDPGHPGAVAAAGHLRRGQRPGRHHHPACLRPARHRFGPGFNGPLQLVGTTGTPADAAAFARLADTLRTVPGIAAVSAPVAGHGASLISVTPTTSPEAKATTTLVSQLRDTVIPAAEHGTTLRVYAGGVTAGNADFATVVGGKLPLFIGVILVLGFLLLMLAFRSLLIPAVAVVMNLLAAAASFGVMVAVFQYGWGLQLLNLGKAGPSNRSCPSSCSPCCSACPWTTRCSWSPGSARNGPPAATTTTPCGPARPPPAGSSSPPPPS